VSTHDIHQQIVTAIATGTGKPVGLGSVPSAQHPTMPYAVVNAMTSPAPTGNMGSRTSNQYKRFCIISVGVDSRQVHWMQDAVIGIMLSAIEPPVTGCQWVELVSQGAIVPDGDVLYSSTDVYQVRM